MNQHEAKSGVVLSPHHKIINFQIRVGSVGKHPIWRAWVDLCDQYGRCLSFGRRRWTAQYCSGSPQTPSPILTLRHKAHRNWLPQYCITQSPRFCYPPMEHKLMGCYEIKNTWHNQLYNRVKSSLSDQHKFETMAQNLTAVLSHINDTQKQQLHRAFSHFSYNEIFK